MDKEFFKKNKFTIMAIIIFVLLVIVGANVAKVFFPNTGTPVYGHRLDGLTPISEETLSKVTTSLKEDKIVSDATTNVSGKILNIIITVDNATNIDSAKKIGESVTTYLDENTLKQYDIEVFVKKEAKEENDFPIIAYKKNTKDTFSWTKNREKTVEGAGE